MSVPEPLVTGSDAAPDGGGAPEGAATPEGRVPEPAAASADPSADVSDDPSTTPSDDPSDGVVDPVTDTPAPPAPADGAADFRMAVVSSVTLDLPSQHPQVCLRELESPRRQLTFAVGMPDAVALAHAQRRIPTPRPLTHELMGEVLQRFDIDLVAVRIVGRLGTVHFAELDLRGRSGRSVHSCRPTDALILALHQPVQVPILIDARLLEGNGDVPPPGSV